MTQANNTSSVDSGRIAIAAEARGIMRRARKGGLATVVSDGAPYASLVTVATGADGAPLVLISGLARHTQNLLRDPRASLLLDETSVAGDPLQGARLSISGTFAKTDDDAAKRRFLARQPDAAGYAGFADFAFWRMDVQGAHYIGGFGRIHDLARADLLLDSAHAAALADSEPGIVEHMNEDHADAIELYAVKLLGGKPGLWRMTGCDAEGCDFVQGDEALRLVFPAPVTSPGDVRKALVELVKRARA